MIGLETYQGAPVVIKLGNFEVSKHRTAIFFDETD
ncbi:MAG: hypothetical protein ACI9V8_001380 [Urechidicola sp.]|jgi:hypothetical protein